MIQTEKYPGLQAAGVISGTHHAVTQFDIPGFAVPASLLGEFGSKYMELSPANMIIVHEAEQRQTEEAIKQFVTMKKSC